MQVFFQLWLTSYLLGPDGPVALFSNTQWGRNEQNHRHSSQAEQEISPKLLGFLFRDAVGHDLPIIEASRARSDTTDS